MLYAFSVKLYIYIYMYINIFNDPPSANGCLVASCCFTTSHISHISANNILSLSKAIPREKKITNMKTMKFQPFVMSDATFVHWKKGGEFPTFLLRKHHQQSSVFSETSETSETCHQKSVTIRLY